MQTNGNTFCAIFSISGKIKKYWLGWSNLFVHTLFFLMISYVPNNWTTIVVKVLGSGFSYFSLLGCIIYFVQRPCPCLPHQDSIQGPLTQESSARSGTPCLSFLKIQGTLSSSGDFFSQNKDEWNRAIETNRRLLFLNFTRKLAVI